MNKSHFRKVFKSDHLGSADLEEMMEAKKPLIFKIREVKQEFKVRVAGKVGNHNIAYFEDPLIKPWVVNVGNCVIIGKWFNSGFPVDWKDFYVEMYVDYNVRLGNDIVSGIRLKKNQPLVETKEEVLAKIESATEKQDLSKLSQGIRIHKLTAEAKQKLKQLEDE